ncbi:MAG: hypothetical protein HC915_09310 [Anaerolineae bacterium]|nr:hypothetical protein [Anaerolineae bacterium]
MRLHYNIDWLAVVNVSNAELDVRQLIFRLGYPASLGRSAEEQVMSVRFPRSVQTNLEPGHCLQLTVNAAATSDTTINEFCLRDFFFNTSGSNIFWLLDERLFDDDEQATALLARPETFQVFLGPITRPRLLAECPLLEAGSVRTISCELRISR